MSSEARVMLDLAARVAYRASGYVEPNPLVGAVVVRGGRVLGVGHHRKYGGPHAEVEAITNCGLRGEDTRGATMYVTLEPCVGRGKQPPCVDAILAAGISRVVVARKDLHPKGAHGLEALQGAGVRAELNFESENATRLSDPFVKATTTGLPWVIAKWAQTIDGRVATRTGESKWISNEDSRRRVHRVRARVDAVLTAVGTVLADDPALTARGGWVRRRAARRVIIDPLLELPEESMLVRTLGEAPLTIYCGAEGLQVHQRKANTLAALGVEIQSLGDGQEVSVDGILRELCAQGVTNVLVEAGPGLLGRLFEGDLVDEAMVFIAPKLLGDDLAKPCVRGRVAERLADAREFRLQRVRKIGDDVQVEYRRPLPE